MQINALFMLGLVSFLFNFALAVYVFISNRQAAKDQELQVAKERITTVEERMRNMPDHAALAQLEGDLREVKTNIGNLNRSLDTLQRGVTRIENYLLDKGK